MTTFLQTALMDFDPVCDRLRIDGDDAGNSPKRQPFQVKSNGLVAHVGRIACGFGNGSVVFVAGDAVEASTLVFGASGTVLALVVQAMWAGGKGKGKGKGRGKGRNHR